MYLIPVVSFIMLYKVVLSFECVDDTPKCDHSNELAAEQYFLVLLFIMMFKVVLTCESDYSNESVTIQGENRWLAEYIAHCENIFSWSQPPAGAVHSCGYKVVQTSESVDEISNYDHSNESETKWKLLSSTSLWHYLLCCTSWF